MLAQVSDFRSAGGHVRSELTSIDLAGLRGAVPSHEQLRSELTHKTTMEEFESIFYGGDVSVSARSLRRHLTAQQRAELARLITEP